METTSADGLNSRFHTGLLMKVRFFWDPDFPSLDTTSRYFGSTWNNGKSKANCKMTSELDVLLICLVSWLWRHISDFTLLLHVERFQLIGMHPRRLQKLSRHDH